MPTVEFEVWCARCGAGLCGQCHDVSGGIKVDPCEHCLEQEYDEGYDRGSYDERAKRD